MTQRHYLLVALLNAVHVNTVKEKSVVAQGLAVSLDKPLEWAVGFFFGNVELFQDQAQGIKTVRRP